MCAVRLLIIIQTYIVIHILFSYLCERFSGLITSFGEEKAHIYLHNVIVALPAPSIYTIYFGHFDWLLANV